MYVKKIRFAHSSPKGNCMVDDPAYFAEVMVVDDNGYIFFVNASEFMYDLTIRTADYSVIDIMHAQFDDERVEPGSAEVQADQATKKEYRTTITKIEGNHLGSHFQGQEKAVDLCAYILAFTRLYIMLKPDYFDDKYVDKNLDDIELPELDFFTDYKCEE